MENGLVSNVVYELDLLGPHLWDDVEDGPSEEHDMTLRGVHPRNKSSCKSCIPRIPYVQGSVFVSNDLICETLQAIGQSKLAYGISTVKSPTAVKSDGTHNNL